MSEALTRGDLNVILEKIVGLTDKISALEQDILAVQATMNAKGHDTPCKALAVLGTKKDAMAVELAELKSHLRVELARCGKTLEGLDERVTTLASQNSVSFDGFANRHDQLRVDFNKDLRELEARCSADVEDAKARSRKKHDALALRVALGEAKAKTAWSLLLGAAAVLQAVGGVLVWWLSQ